jgi:serine/threonine-protein kinase
MVAGEINIGPSHGLSRGVDLARTFRLQEALSAGPRADVWRGVELGSDREVVVKVAAAGRRFVDQALALTALGHRNLVRALHHGKLADGRAYVVLEHVQGVRLRRVLAGGLDAPRAMPILSQLACALTAAHGQGLAHGALTPEHVMLTDNALDDARWTVRLLGLGTSHDAVDPAYAAPEQLAGDRADARSDVFAFAALAVEMVCGVGPFVSTSLRTQDTLERRRAGALPCVSPRVPAHLQAPLARALACNPADRYPTIVEIARALAVPVSRGWLARGTRPIVHTK